jgi:protein CpxP
MMKTFAKLGMVLGVSTILFTTSAFAQKTAPKHKMEQNKEQRSERFAEAIKRLNLTDDQQTKIKVIMEKNRTEMKALRASKKDSPKDEKHAAMMTQMKKVDGQIATVLDNKQQDIYKQMKAEKKAKMQEKQAERMEKREEMEEYQNVF